MEILSIDLLQEPNQEFYVLVEEKQCTINLRQLGESVFFSLNINDEDIVQNEICNDRTPMPTRATSALKGKFVFVDTLGTKHPTYDGFNDRFAFNYVRFEDEDG